MVKPLLDVVFMSEKRKGVLLLLRDGAKEMEYLLRFLDTTRQALLPQIRILEEHHLVDHCKDVYELTAIGRLVADEMLPLLGTLEVLEMDVEYWGTHNLDFIPPNLLKRINELGKCRIMSPSTEKVHEADDEFIETSTQYHYSITTFFYPNFMDLFSRMLSKGTNLHVIISQNLFDKLRTNNYSDIQKLLSNELVHFFVSSKKINFLYFVFSEHYLLISPLKNTGEFDNKYVFCKTPSAIDWAREVFDYYLKDSKPITEI